MIPVVLFFASALSPPFCMTMTFTKNAMSLAGWDLQIAQKKSLIQFFKAFMQPLVKNICKSETL